MNGFSFRKSCVAVTVIPDVYDNHVIWLEVQFFKIAKNLVASNLDKYINLIYLIFTMTGFENLLRQNITRLHRRIGK